MSGKTILGVLCVVVVLVIILDQSDKRKKAQQRLEKAEQRLEALEQGQEQRVDKQPRRKARGHENGRESQQANSEMELWNTGSRTWRIDENSLGYVVRVLEFNPGQRHYFDNELVTDADIWLGVEVKNFARLPQQILAQIPIGDSNGAVYAPYRTEELGGSRVYISDTLNPGMVGHYYYCYNVPKRAKFFWVVQGKGFIVIDGADANPYRTSQSSSQRRRQLPHRPSDISAMTPRNPLIVQLEQALSDRNTAAMKSVYLAVSDSIASSVEARLIDKALRDLADLIRVLKAADVDFDGKKAAITELEQGLDRLRNLDN